MPPTIPSGTIGSNVFITYTTAPAAVLNLSCYITAFEITPNTEEIDIGVYCNPSASEIGRTMFSAVLSLLWEPALYDLLQPHIGQVGKFAFIPVAIDADKGVEFTTKFGAQPWGRFELGQRVEVDLPLAVLDTPVWNIDRIP